MASVAQHGDIVGAPMSIVRMDVNPFMAIARVQDEFKVPFVPA